MRKIPLYLVATLASLSLSATAFSQFVDPFEDQNVDGWDFYTGDGDAIVDFVPQQTFATMKVDATEDAHNVWWAILRRDVSSFVDLAKLESPEYELRVEVRLRTSEAPRRVNIMINTQRTTDYHKQLREYDIDQAGEWRTISFTTEDLDAKPGDNLYVQLGMTDWGFDRYEIDVDSYQAKVVRVADNEPEKGEPLVYHPHLPPVETYQNHLSVAEDALVNQQFPKVNFEGWTSDGEPTLTVSDRQFAILRWDFSEFAGKTADGGGVLELTTHSQSLGGHYSRTFGEDLGMEFGKIRIFEILAGQDDWDDETVTYQTFTQGQDLWKVVNEQMTFDTELTKGKGGKTEVYLSRPVMQRLLDGTTRGFILMPLGAIDASLYDSQAGESNAAKIHFSLKE